SAPAPTLDHFPPTRMSPFHSVIRYSPSRPHHSGICLGSVIASNTRCGGAAIKISATTVFCWGETDAVLIPLLIPRRFAIEVPPVLYGSSFSVHRFTILPDGLQQPWPPGLVVLAHLGLIRESTVGYLQARPAAEGTQLPAHNRRARRLLMKIGHPGVLQHPWRIKLQHLAIMCVNLSGPAILRHEFPLSANPRFQHPHCGFKMFGAAPGPRLRRINQRLKHPFRGRVDLNLRVDCILIWTNHSRHGSTFHCSSHSYFR